VFYLHKYSHSFSQFPWLIIQFFSTNVGHDRGNTSVSLYGSFVRPWFLDPLMQPLTQQTVDNSRKNHKHVQSRTTKACHFYCSRTACINGPIFVGSYSALKKESIAHFSRFLANCLGCHQNFEGQKM
jgi:hypothetical protein